MDRKVIKIDSIPSLTIKGRKNKDGRRVAAYARVSTRNEEQLHSLSEQKDFYTRFIKKHKNWIFCGLYVDEGISGTTYKKRDGFQHLIADALSGKIDLILTKSISRFARNTVDTLNHIRKLKEHNVEVYFEKEDIWTFDSKGEFILTMMSSFAQEESRSISENIIWGVRKRFSEGKYTVPFSRFIGYDRGSHGELIVNEKQALIIKMIFRLFLYGKSKKFIAKYLTKMGIPTASNKKVPWQITVIHNMLTNEKYKGDALTQKTYNLSYITKKAKRNEGELPRYYVTNGHPPIIPPRTFDYAQQVVEEVKNFPCHLHQNSPFSRKLQCLYCKSYFGIKHAHNKDLYWKCNYKEKDLCNDSVSINNNLLSSACILVIKWLIKNTPEVTAYINNLGLTALTEQFTPNENNVTSESDIFAVIIKKAIISRNYIEFHFIDGRRHKIHLEKTKKAWKIKRG